MCKTGRAKAAQGTAAYHTAAPPTEQQPTPATHAAPPPTVEADDVMEKATACKFFIMSTEFDKNITDWSYDCTDHKNGIDFFMRLVNLNGQK